MAVTVIISGAARIWHMMRGLKRRSLRTQREATAGNTSSQARRDENDEGIENVLEF